MQNNGRQIRIVRIKIKEVQKIWSLGHHISF